MREELKFLVVGCVESVVKTFRSGCVQGVDYITSAFNLLGRGPCTWWAKVGGSLLRASYETSQSSWAQSSVGGDTCI